MEWVLPAPEAVSNKPLFVLSENIVRTQPNMPQQSDNPHLDDKLAHSMIGGRDGLISDELRLYTSLD
jgi:hypothetical protein